MQAGEEEVVFAGEREATNVARQDFQRGEGSGLGAEKGVKASQCQSQRFGHHGD